MVNTRLRIFLCLDTERGDTEIQRGGRIQMIQREGKIACDKNLEDFRARTV